MIEIEVIASSNCLHMNLTYTTLSSDRTTILTSVEGFCKHFAIRLGDVKVALLSSNNLKQFKIDNLPRAHIQSITCGAKVVFFCRNYFDVSHS